MATETDPSDIQPDSEKKIPEFLLKIVEGYSTYNKVYIKYWMAIALLSLVIIVSTNTKNKVEVTLPFDIGTLDRDSFYPFAFAILAILVICFGSTFSQSFRSSKLMYRAVEKLEDDYIFFDRIYLRDIIDCLYYPSLTRVAPLSQLARGKYQFFPESKHTPKFLGFITTIYYVLLKIVAISVMYLLPAAALLLSFFKGIWGKKNALLNIPIFVFWVFGVTSMVILIQLLIEDLSFLSNVSKLLLGKPSKK